MHKNKNIIRILFWICFPVFSVLITNIITGRVIQKQVRDASEILAKETISRAELTEERLARWNTEKEYLSKPKNVKFKNPGQSPVKVEKN